MDEKPKLPTTTFARLIAKRDQKTQPTNDKSDGSDVRPTERPAEPPVGRSSDRPADRPKRPSAQLPTDSDHYVINGPAERLKYRQAFDVFKDQKSALEKLQLATAASTGNKPAMGYMVQQALDLYIKKRALQLPNVRFKKQPDAPQKIHRIL